MSPRTRHASTCHSFMYSLLEAENQGGKRTWACPHLSYVAKCNLGKVNLEATLVSSFSCYTGGGPMPLTGTSRDLYMQLLACLQFFAKCFSIACCLHASLCFGFSHPSLPPS